MNEVCLNNRMLPLVWAFDLSAASEPFFHADRNLPYHVLIYVLEGAIYVTEEDADYQVQGGELLFLKSGCRHFGKKEIPRGTRWYYCHFFYEQTEEFPDFGEAEGLKPDRESPLLAEGTSPLSVRLPKKLSGLRDSEIERKLAELTAFAHSGDGRKIWELNGRFFSALEEIAFYSGEKDGSVRLSDKIAGFLSEHLTEDFSSEKLEKNFFLSYKHMAAVFKKEKQTTLWQYHQRARMGEACRLLKSTLCPVGEIAKTLGYQDMLYFSRCFHKFTGMSPTDYRKTASGIY